MIRLPTQFDARARHTAESAAAEGSTSTTCSSCIVTLGLASLGTSMHFHGLKRVAPDVEADGTETEPGPGRPATSAPVAGSGVLGFFLPTLTLIVTGFLALGGLGPMSLAAGGGLWVALWVITYKDVGRSSGVAVLVSVLALAIALVIGSVEMKMWVGH